MKEHDRLIAQSRRLRKIALLLREQGLILATIPFMLGNPQMDRYREISDEIASLRAEQAADDVEQSRPRS